MALVELATTLILNTTPTQVADFDKEALKLEIEKNLVINLDIQTKVDLSTSVLKIAKTRSESKKVSRQAD